MHSVAVYLVQRLYGGPEEGGWHYDSGALCTDPALTAFGVTFAEGHEDRARTMALEVRRISIAIGTSAITRARSAVSSPLGASRHTSTWLAPSRLSGRVSPLRMTRTAWVSHFANLQESGLLKTFTGPLANTLPITVRKSRSRRKMSSAPAAPLVDASHTIDGWKSLDTEHPTYVSACR